MRLRTLVTLVAVGLLGSSYAFSQEPTPDPTPTAPVNHAELEGLGDDQVPLITEKVTHQKRIMLKDGRYYPVVVTQRERILRPSEIRLQKEAEANNAEGIRKTGVGIRTEPKQLEYPGDLLMFEIPQSDTIPGCTYTSSFSFPDFCNNSTNEIIFTAGRDPQSVLDELMLKHGIVSKYNVVPKDYDPDLQSYPYPAIKFPEEELRKLGDEFKKAHPEYVPPPLE